MKVENGAVGGIVIMGKRRGRRVGGARARVALVAMALGTGGRRGRGGGGIGGRGERGPVSETGDDVCFPRLIFTLTNSAIHPMGPTLIFLSHHSILSFHTLFLLSRACLMKGLMKDSKADLSTVIREDHLTEGVMNGKLS